MSEKERIQKLLSRAGYGSRRQIERWIGEGEILVDGTPATLGQAIDTNSRIVLKGQKLSLKDKLKATPRVLLYHKPSGEVCTRKDDKGRPTVFGKLPKITNGRWIMVGRLDINTDGLLIFTNDGELANRLMHPSYEIEREYAVRVLGEVDDEILKNLTSGVELEDGIAKFKRIKFAGGEGKNRWYHVVLSEGKNREVRRIWESQGIMVSRLIRIRYGDILLERSLKSGKSYQLPFNRTRTLYESVGLTLELPNSKTYKKNKYKNLQNKAKHKYSRKN